MYTSARYGLRAYFTHESSFVAVERLTTLNASVLVVPVFMREILGPITVARALRLVYRLKHIPEMLLNYLCELGRHLRGSPFELFGEVLEYLFRRYWFAHSLILPCRNEAILLIGPSVVTIRR